MPKIRFLEAGRWCDTPAKPVFDVAQGDVVDVSFDTADYAVSSGKAEYVKDEAKQPAKEPTAKRKGKAGPIAKAEY